MSQRKADTSYSKSTPSVRAKVKKRRLLWGEAKSPRALSGLKKTGPNTYVMDVEGDLTISIQFVSPDLAKKAATAVASGPLKEKLDRHRKLMLSAPDARLVKAGT